MSSLLNAAAMVVGQQVAPAPSGPTGTVAYVAEYSSGANASSYTFSSSSIGTADADRTVIVAVASRKSGATTTISSVTVGGVAATEVAQASNTISNTNVAGLYAIDVAAGTTADIVVTFGATMLRAGIGVYRCTGISTTANNTDTSTASDLAGSVTRTSVGVVVGVATDARTSAVWAGITEDFDATIGAESSQFTGASDAGTAGAVAITCTWSPGITEPVAAYAAW